MDMKALVSALDIATSPLNNLDDMFTTLELTSQRKELIITGGNEEVLEIIQGMKLTKYVRKRINKKTAMLNWIHETKLRYNRYLGFVDNSKDEFPEICKNILIINKYLHEQNISFRNIVKLVYKTDKMIIKILKKFDCIK